MFRPFSQSWLREALDKGPKVSCSPGQNTKFPPISYPTWFSFFQRHFLGPLLCARGYPRSTGGKVCKLVEGSLESSSARVMTPAGTLPWESGNTLSLLGSVHTMREAFPPWPPAGCSSGEDQYLPNMHKAQIHFLGRSHTCNHPAQS